MYSIRNTNVLLKPDWHRLNNACQPQTPYSSARATLTLLTDTPKHFFVRDLDFSQPTLGYSQLAIWGYYQAVAVAKYHYHLYQVLLAQAGNGSEYSDSQTWHRVCRSPLAVSIRRRPCVATCNYVLHISDASHTVTRQPLPAKLRSSCQWGPQAGTVGYETSQ